MPAENHDRNFPTMRRLATVSGRIAATDEPCIVQMQRMLPMKSQRRSERQSERHGKLKKLQWGEGPLRQQH